MHPGVFGWGGEGHRRETGAPNRKPSLVAAKSVRKKSRHAWNASSAVFSTNAVTAEAIEDSSSPSDAIVANRLSAASASRSNAACAVSNFSTNIGATSSARSPYARDETRFQTQNALSRLGLSASASGASTPSFTETAAPGSWPTASAKWNGAFVAPPYTGTRSEVPASSGAHH